MLVLSGDVHASAVFRLEHEAFPLANVWQITSSAIAQPNLPEDLLDVAVIRDGRLGLRNTGPVTFARMTSPIVKNNAVVIDVNTERSDGGLSATYIVRSDDGACDVLAPIYLAGVPDAGDSALEERTRDVIVASELSAARRLVAAVASGVCERFPSTPEERVHGAQIRVGAVNLRGLNLFGFDLSTLDLSRARLDADALAGTIVEGANLPAAVELAVRDASVASEAASLHRSVLTYVALSAAGLLTVMALPGPARYDDGYMAALPGFDVPVSAFLGLPMGSVLLGLGMVYLAQRMRALLGNMARLPLQAPDGRWLDEQVVTMMPTPEGDAPRALAEQLAGRAP
ncbi:MAG: hypothetical protein KDA28_05015, partial [Phycisphaerales bacterium]|nr:hypothetical protein [Phycisphaerales bacterium]